MQSMKTAELEGKVAIVTGASRGIGKAIALRLAGAGTRVVVASKTAQPHPRLPGTIHDTVREIREAGGTASAVQCDVRLHADLQRVVDTALADYGRIDILINNAGAIWLRSLADTDESRLDLVLDVNFRAPFLLARLCLPHMAANSWGHIVNMGPPLLQQATNSSGMIAYLTSKLGATLMAHGLGDELKGTGIACNSLWPRTLIESAVTTTFGLGRPDDWRRSDILVDAVMLILAQDCRTFTGQALIDEDVLGEYGGVVDFSRYSVVEGSRPAAMNLALFKDMAAQAQRRAQAAT
ncbi:SDR family oxidoreductase [Caldimonas brevitalea]|uniref:Citronellol/citronellal dehydrogenase n=1 Tax=Caldimonas brevitalea TaxID=413882 RepID=A0A0G3BH73_9BURK|nr:SDR family oxidoreductase [Caldimonas brevitalea]AKJ27308.1 citronellol/citronellal dehydrogenase [Caldimonas brevitalea]